MYHYFTNKEQLAAVVLEGIADYQAAFMEELDHHEDVQNSILAVIQNCLK
jgi:AcrR family transcriptional regulator